MPHAIIIAFSYNNDLPGAKADIINMTKFCQRFNYTYDIITDTQTIHISLFEELLLRSLGKMQNKLLLYYSGHGKNDSIQLSNGFLYPFLRFRNFICANLPPQSKDVEIFWILDCCNPNGLHLPFKLHNNSFHYQIDCIHNFLTSTENNKVPKILLITSSDNDEKSVATINGSLFTTELLKLIISLHEALASFISKYDNIILTATNRNLQRFLGQLAANIRVIQHEYRQNVCIYSSFNMDPILWMWLTEDIDISTHYSNNAIILKSKVF